MVEKDARVGEQEPPFRTVTDLISEIAADAAISFYSEWSGGAIENAKGFFRRGLATRIARDLNHKREPFDAE